MVSSQNTIIAHLANGVATTFAFDFLVQRSADLQVVLLNTDASEATPISYSVTGLGLNTGGTITFSVAPANGLTVVIYRKSFKDQEKDYVPNDDFPAETHETALDRSILLHQENQRDIGTSLRFPVSENVQLNPLTKALRSGKMIEFDVNGNLTFITKQSIVDAGAAASAASALAAANSANAASSSEANALNYKNQAQESANEASDSEINSHNSEVAAAASAALAASFQPRIEVANVASLKALSTDSIQDGWVATVLGYYAAGDGGGGEFRFVAASSTSDNLGTVFQPNVGTGRWHRIINGGLANARWFGAKGDNVADDTAAIQRAIDAGVYGLFGIRQGTFAYLPAGVYRITSTLFIGYPLTTNPYGFVTGGLIGEETARYPYSSTRIKTAFATLNRPAIAMESGRGHTVKFIAVEGQMIPPVPYSDTSHRNFCFDQNAYANAEIQAQSANQRRYSPYAGIVSNAWSAEPSTTSAAPYPSVTIPSYVPTVGGTTVTRGNWISAQSTVEYSDVQRFDVGVLFNAYAGNNGDMNLTRVLSISECVYGISAGQANQRQFIVQDCHISFCYCAMVDTVHGFQRGRLYAAVNCEIDYCQFWFFQSGTGEIFTLERCYGEGGGVMGTGERLRLVNCQFQAIFYNNLKFPLIRATGHLEVNGLSLQQAGGGGGTSDITQHWSKTSITPFVIVASGFDMNNLCITAPASGEPAAVGFVANSFVSDLDSAPTTTLLEENRIICAQVLNFNNALVLIRNNGLDAGGEGFGRMRSIDVRGAGSFTNRFLQNGWIRIGGSTGGTKSQRSPLPFWIEGFLGESGERINMDGMYSGASVAPNWSAFSALIETTDSFTSGGNTYQLRNLYVNLVWSGTRRLRKGWMYACLVGSLPVVMVAVNNPTETGVANTWRFKIIYGFDGRGEFPHGLALPGSGTLLGNNAGLEYKPTRCVNFRGRIIATFTSGSNVVTFDTSVGFDATLFFQVDDVFYASDPRVMVRSGAYQTSNGSGASAARITAISSASQVTIASNSPISTTCEIWLN